MPTNGLLVNLADDKDAADDAVAQMRARQQIELGERNERYLPIVVESQGVKDSHDVHEWIERLPGVIAVEVVFASVDEPVNNNLKTRKSNHKNV